jgi:hypothetical protein
MNEQQKAAFDHPCRLGIETLHPRFGRVNGLHSIVLTINYGYE